MAGTKTVEYCLQHAQGGMVNVFSRMCRTRGCGKNSSFGVANTRTAEYCPQYARLQCDVERFKKVEIGPHHSGKETVGGVNPSDSKHTTVHPPPTKTGQPSGLSQGSRKRARHSETTSTVSKPAVARESTAGAGTEPDIDGLKSPVKRDSSVKTEVQVSL
ncbi:unnamed protein product [Ascophyllum nodosum]